MTLAAASPLQLIDWPSLAWVALIGALTFATLTVKARYERVHAMGPMARALAHVAIGYFGVGMTAFGLWAALRAHFPVPGGVGWEGAIGVVGGLAAVTIGSCTLGEHLVAVLALQRAERPAESGSGAGATVEA